MTLDCLHHMEISGRFNFSHATLASDKICSSDAVVEVNPNDLFVEDEWRHAYERRKGIWKQHAIEHGHLASTSSKESVEPSVSINFGEELHHASSSAVPDLSPSIVQQVQQNTRE